MQLLAYQAEDVAKIRAHRLRGFLASEQGTGKTAVAVRALALEHAWACPALVVAPASVVGNWANEIGSWAPGLRVWIAKSHQHLALGDRMAPGSVLIVSWHLMAQEALRLGTMGFRSLILDEAHYVKNPDSARAQAALSLARPSNGLLLLTGTPVVNDEGELRALQALFQGTPYVFIRRLTSEVLTHLPPKKRILLPVVAHPKTWVSYKTAEEDFEGWLEERASQPGSWLPAGKYYASAFARISALRRLIGLAKVPAAVEWIARVTAQGEPVVIFLEHQAVLAQLRRKLRRLRVKHEVIEGSTRLLERTAIVERFQKGKVPVLVGTAAAREGITLTRSCHVAFLERCFTSAAEEQAEDRLRRLGQKRVTHVWRFHVPDSIDDRLHELVLEKRQIVRLAVGASKVTNLQPSVLTQLVDRWLAFQAEGGKKSVSSLGCGKSPPPYPGPSQVLALCFTLGWPLARLVAWTQLHGYACHQLKVHHERRWVYCQSPSAFQPGSFRSYRLGSSVIAYTGQRGKKRRGAKQRRY
jgi:SNF2 family DNA or RNA helicase